MSEISSFKKSDAFRSKIHNLIPGGAHTYSKGDDQFPLMSPAAIKRGKGAWVWDLDDNKYLDCSMGLTSVSLGHAYEPVNSRVRDVLEIGVNFQRPASLELEMAEAFLKLIPQHDMIKFAKNGSSVTTAAVKLARAKTGRKIVAFPADHPFYSYDDWFIGKTLCNRGVPEEISALSVTYNSQNIDALKDLISKYKGQIAAVITEPVKFTDLPYETYLADLKSLCESDGILLIFDEMVCGFKVDFPGAISKYGVIPDMATWGKGIANGFSFCALTGKKEVMELGGIKNEGEDKVFLMSSTHGGETIGLAAGLATIEEFQNKNVVKHNHQIGRSLIDMCRSILRDKKLEPFIKVYDCEWMPVFVFHDKNGSTCNGMRTLMLQEMIKRGVLFQGIFSPCFSHGEVELLFFTKAFEDSLETYRSALEIGYERFLQGPPTKPVFRKTI